VFLHNFRGQSKEDPANIYKHWEAIDKHGDQERAFVDGVGDRDHVSFILVIASKNETDVHCPSREDIERINQRSNGVRFIGFNVALLDEIGAAFYGVSLDVQHVFEHIVASRWRVGSN
jgi:hypothetical protein